VHLNGSDCVEPPRTDFLHVFMGSCEIHKDLQNVELGIGYLLEYHEIYFQFLESIVGILIDLTILRS